MNLAGLKARLHKLESRRADFRYLDDQQLRDLLQVEFTDVCGRFHIQPATLADVPVQVMDDPLAAKFFEFFFSEVSE